MNRVEIYADAIPACSPWIDAPGAFKRGFIERRGDAVGGSEYGGTSRHFYEQLASERALPNGGDYTDPRYCVNRPTEALTLAVANLLCA